jgi:hypothetical protein
LPERGGLRVTIYWLHDYIFLQEEKFDDTKGVIKSRKSKKDRQYNGQKKKNKRTNNDLQIITQKT